MNKIRITEEKTPRLKAFYIRFAKHFEYQTRIRLRGNLLLNVVAEAAGHTSYSALLFDSKTYGNGPFHWDSLPVSLFNGIAHATGSDSPVCLNALAKALLDEHDASADNDTRVLEPAVDDVNIDEGSFVIGLNLFPSRMTFTDSTETARYRTIIQRYLSLPNEVKLKVVFVGDVAMVLRMLQPGLVPTSATLKQNSLKALGMHVFFATSDISELANSSTNQTSSVIANSKVQIIQENGV